MEPTTDPTTEPTITYTDQLDMLLLANETLINRMEMMILLIIFLSCLFVYSLFRRNTN